MVKKSQSTTIKDLAEHARVSPATVSRVINNSAYVSDITRNRVQAAINELGYRPDARARGLRGMPSGLIALIIPDILNVFYTYLSQIIEEKLRQAGYTMLLGVTKDNPDLYINYLNQFRELKVDGIICVPPPDSEKCAGTIKELIQQGMPTVEVNRRHTEQCLDSVLADNLQGARLGTQYLLGLGHQRIALIVGSLDTSTGKDRLEGFQWVMANAGLKVDPALIKVGEFSKRFGISATNELIQLRPRPTAIITTSNRLLMGTITVLAENQIRVPEDISILSFDDSEWLSFWHPPITAIDIAVDEMGTLAVELLMRWIASGKRPEIPRNYSLSTTLIERKSCAPLNCAG